MKYHYLIRKNNICGHWHIIKIMETNYDIEFYAEIAHLESFTDVLLLINGEADLVVAD